MGWAERNKDGQKRHANRDTRVSLIDRPGIIAVVCGDRTTYPQSAGCVTGIASTPGSHMYWEMAGGARRTRWFRASATQLSQNGTIFPLFQISKAPRVTEYAFAAPQGTAEKWLAADACARRDPAYIGRHK